MTDKQIIEAMQKMDGSWIGHNWRNFADYLNDHNAIQRIIDELNDETVDEYMYQLEEVTSANSRLISGIEANARLMQATPPQKCEAFLRLFGKWKEKETEK